MKRYDEIFASTPEVAAVAPGRVNLLGEHTDYNDGFVLPIAIAQCARVTLGRSREATTSVYAADFDQLARFTLEDTPQERFARMVQGCLRILAEQGVAVPALDIHVTSQVPMGAGLSSSAALQVALLRALDRLLGLALDGVRIAQLGQQVESRFAGVQCGIMDQMAASLADAQHMLFIDTRKLERRRLPLPAHAELLVLDSGEPRDLASVGYNARRAECTEAARRLGVAALRDVTDAARVATLPEPLARRARHVVRENARVRQAVAGVDAATFGALMNASHDSLRDDFEVSTPALDRLVALLREHEAVYGARLTGAGFGGACVALCRIGTAQAVARATLARYDGRGRVLVAPEAGAPRGTP